MACSDKPLMMFLVQTLCTRYHQLLLLLNTKFNELEMPPQPIEAKSPFPSDISSSQIAPSQIARQFAKKAASILETREVELLIDFLEKPRQIDREIANRVVRIFTPKY